MQFLEFFLASFFPNLQENSHKPTLHLPGQRDPAKLTRLTNAKLDRAI